MNPIFFSKAVGEAHSVFVDSSNEAVCNTNVERAAYAVGQNVHPVRMIGAHAGEIRVYWIIRFRG